MRRLLLGALAAGLLALGAPAASAHDNNQVKWGCGLTSIPNFINAEGSNQYYLYGVAVTPETGGGTFWCEVRLNGVTQASSIHTHGEVAFATAGPLRGWRSDPDDDFEVCGHITWDDGHAPFDSCTPTVPLPGDPIDLINQVLIELDFLTCAALIAAAPGVPGIVDIDPTGDTLVFGIPFWDCPPYETS